MEGLEVVLRGPQFPSAPRRRDPWWLCGDFLGCDLLGDVTRAWVPGHSVVLVLQGDQGNGHAVCDVPHTAGEDDPMGCEIFLILGCRSGGA